MVTVYNADLFLSQRPGDIPDSGKDGFIERIKLNWRNRLPRKADRLLSKLREHPDNVTKIPSFVKRMKPLKTTQ